MSRVVDPLLTLEQRVALLLQDFPNTTVRIQGGRAEGVWMLGQNFQRAWDFHGAYLKGYLARIEALFRDIPYRRRVHLFSGEVPRGPWLRVDIYDRLSAKDGSADPNFIQADICGRHEPFMREEDFQGRRLFLADPPYHEKDCRIYGCAPIDRAAAMQQIAKVAEPGAILVWLDCYEPLHRRVQWDWIGFFALRVCNSHQLRGVWIFQRK